MSNRFVQFIKDHPYISAGSAALLVGLYYYSRSGGNDATTYTNVTGSDAAAVQAGTQYQMAQLQANAASHQSDNEAAVATHSIDVNAIIEGLKSQDTLAAVSASRDVNLAGIAAGMAVQTNADNLYAQTTQAVSLLQAQVAENQIAANVAQTDINAKAYVNIADAPYASADYIASLNNSRLTSDLANANAQIDNLTTLNTNLSAANTNLQTEFDDSVVKISARVPGSPTYNIGGPGTEFTLGSGKVVQNYG